mmetsp:Transcript_22075/g.53451  ORF Transcript_22075/g.53451 Transcript_22075/m.53451 type:complete len:484 (+) Transcript_22075:156-1607(+)
MLRRRLISVFVVIRALFVVRILLLPLRNRAVCAFVASPTTTTTTTAATRASMARPSSADKELEPDDNDESPIPSNKMIVSRRASIASIAGLVATAGTSLPRDPAIADPTIPSDAIAPPHPPLPSLSIPLQYRPRLSAYTVSYKIGTSNFGAIVDTGSPFLLVPRESDATCRPEYEWGCFHREESREATGLGPTLERFDGNEGWVEWREGEFSFDASASKDGTSQSLLFPRSLMTFGVISESLMDGPGGIFLGLVKHADTRIRPSFLGQSDVSAFSVDLRERGDDAPKALTLYGTAATSGTTVSERRTGGTWSDSSSVKIGDTTSTSFTDMLPRQSAVPLIRTLNKRYGDPTVHYVGMASSIIVNGSHNLSSSPTSERGGRKIYCILDTGCSGMSVSPGLFDERYASARANKEKTLWGTVDVAFRTLGGETVTLNAKRPITTPLGSERPWGKKLDGHLVVLGLAFLEGKRMTVDIDGNKVWFES